MYKTKKILVVVPARKGSKGIPLKNIVEVNGVPLIQYVGHVTKKVEYIDKCIVSTDSKKIAKLASEVDIEFPFLRPKDLSGPSVSDLQVLKHALIEMESIDKTSYDIILMLQPTSPTRKTEHVIQVIKKIIDESFDSVWTISKLDVKYHPLKQMKINDNKLHYYDEDGVNIISRQQIQEDTYLRNGIAYAFTREYVLNNNKLINQNTGYVLITEPSINIDTYEDLEIAKELLNSQKR